ncbi:1-deoxy-D-xylulose-5-phosphate synthase [Kribbella sp. VKM Ac-2568]|uniref:1-deoxy-D-xylulose-5-phosphate synthase n=1 Tax=Kribbella sp. VKM Ac-2568 TaxID=2512219 RepID=UPI00104D4AFA|nr:1-deoxy-D-xylulose-5-phosphate synthase [Kribbella sp. VKM Ac-2568]TCM49974.1 1-deoxy-D-xylulose-5-phosphate synthase [Kribbella sp. VKM Ac-2568]
MGVLEAVGGPADLRGMTDHQLRELATEIRDVLVETVSRTGGHLGPNLGMVEITLAMHRVFDSPRDRLVYDTGHQTYVHKLLTGRAPQFDSLRQQGGLSGYPSQAESEHDVVENSHASTSLSYADGLAKAYRLRGEDRHVVALIGDGGLTGGMAWEALNNIAAAKDLKLVIIVNDNGRSYSPTVGGLATHLTSLRTNPRYEKILDLIKKNLGRTPYVGPPMYEVLHGVKKGLKDMLAPQGMFEDLGLKYVGPVDGHDRQAMEDALTKAKAFGGPVIVHAVTQKGFGYAAAEQDEEDNFHQVRPKNKPRGWTEVFADELVEIGHRRPDVVAITAAMLHPTGLAPFAQEFPDRIFDVGIAEQHAVTSAAGLAMGGLHPVVGLYATFLNRAFDQLLLDVALHKCGVTFVLDRAGVTGDDGASHNGMWDMSLLQLVPGLRLAAPRDGSRLRELLNEAIEVEDAPTVLRYAKGEVFPDIEAIDRVGDCDVLVKTGTSVTAGADVLLVGIGSMAATAVDVATRLQDQGFGVTVVDPRWVKPVDPKLVELAGKHKYVVTIEDNGRAGGCGSAICQALRDAGVTTPVRDFGIPQQFLDHAKRDAVLTAIGLTGQGLARDVIEMIAKHQGDAITSEPDTASGRPGSA